MELNTAIILYGVVHRSLRYTAEPFRRQVVHPFAAAGGVDLYFHSWDNHEVHNPRGGESHLPVNADDIAHCLPEADGMIEHPGEMLRAESPAIPLTHNPFRHCTSNEHDARISLRNYRLGLESLRRAYAHFTAQKTKTYDMVVISRPDVRYLGPVPIQPHAVDRGMLYLPMFHRYGGYNDRFAIGSEHSASVYCDRVLPAEQALNQGQYPINTETFLMRFLDGQGINVGMMDAVFQRVRADGSVFMLDQALANESR